MPLPTPVARQHLHTRQIECRGFFRSDGLWDIEGHIADTKTYQHSNEHRGTMGPQDPIHDMSIRLTIDDKFVIHDVAAVTDASPFRICPDITPDFKKLIGLRVGPGFHRQVRERLGGVHGCVHIVELLGPVATVAFQTLQADKAAQLRRERDQKLGIAPKPRDPNAPKRAPRVLDTCHAWASSSEVVKRWAPDFYTGPKDVA